MLKDRILTASKAEQQDNQFMDKTLLNTLVKTEPQVKCFPIVIHAGTYLAVLQQTQSYLMVMTKTRLEKYVIPKLDLDTVVDIIDNFANFHKFKPVETKNYKTTKSCYSFKMLFSCLILEVICCEKTYNLEARISMQPQNLLKAHPQISDKTGERMNLTSNKFRDKVER